MKLASDATGLIDLARAPSGALALEDTLTSAVIISLLTDRRAGPDDRLPDGETAQGLIPPDRRGWAGDALSDIDGDRIGSRLWLLSREKQTEETRARAEGYAREALQWLRDDGHVTDLSVAAAWARRGWLDIHTEMTPVNGPLFKLTVPVSPSAAPPNALRDNAGHLVLDGGGHFILMNPPGGV